MCYLKQLYFNIEITLDGKVIYKMPYTIHAENDSVAIKSITSLLDTLMDEDGYTPGEIGCMNFNILKCEHETLM